MSLPEFTRRAALGALLASAARPARALGPASRFDIAELRIAGCSLSRPRAWERLLFEVDQSTSVEVEPRSVEVEADDPALFAHPFAVLIADRPVPAFTDAVREQLTRYLTYGGFLLVDDATGSPSGPVMPSIQAALATLFPTRPLSPLPRDHSVERAFFLLTAPYGRVDAVDHLDGVTVGPITPVIVCGNDLSGALDRLPNGGNAQPCLPGGEWQRREAIKLGINLVLYALTSNYKHDIAHVLELMRDGRIE